MKIRGYRSTIVTMPYARRYKWRVADSGGITAILIELETDSGLVGLGESPCVFPPAEALKLIVDASMKSIVGEDPFDHERIYKKILGSQGLYYDRVLAGLALSGVDLALWDLMGKATGYPIYKLLGGAFHAAVPFVCIIPIDEPRVMAEDARKAVETGCRTLYFKYCDSEDDLIGRLKAIRKAIGPRIKIRIDFNQALSPGFAIKFIKEELEEFNLEAVEQPCGEEDYEGLRYVKQSLSVPVIADESSKTLQHALNVVRGQAADVVQIDHCTSDGIWGAKKISGMCEAAGLPIVFHSLGELGPNQMKTVQLAISTPNATMDHQTLYNYNADDVISGGMLKFNHWTMLPPEKPGLGVDLDREKVQQYAALYKETGGMYLMQTSTSADLPQVPLISSRISRSWNAAPEHAKVDSE